MNRLAMSAALAALLISPAVMAQSMGEKNRRQLGVGRRADHGGFRQGGRHQRHARNRGGQDRGRKGQRGRKEIRGADDHRSHQDEFPISSNWSAAAMSRPTFRRAWTPPRRRSWTSCATPSRPTSPASTTRCRSVPMRMRCRCSSAMRNRATASSSRTGQGRPLPALQHHLDMAKGHEQEPGLIRSRQLKA